MPNETEEAMNTMTQNIYDDPTFFTNYARLNRSVQGLAGAPEWPAIKNLLPDMQDLSVVDLGCGYGWFCRWARENGAAKVLGLDVSARMLAQADSLTSDPAIAYVEADLEALFLPEAAFDLAYSSLAFHYLENLPTLFATLHRALSPAGRLVFSIEHPIYMASLHPDWIIDEQLGRIWPVDHYQDEGPRRTNWLAEGVIKQHRTLGTLLNALIASGFTLRHIEDWGPSGEQVAKHPELEEERQRPMLLLVAASR